MNQETKLGLFVLAAITCLVVSIYLLGDFQFQQRYSLNVIFSDVAGLPAKGKVKIAGVEVGSIKKIVLVGSKAKITVWVNSDIKIHSDAEANIVATGIIGSKYLELTMGSEDKPLLKDGDIIKGTSPMSIEKVMSTVMDKLDSVFGVFESEDGKNMGGNLAVTIKNLREITDSLKNVIAEREGKLGETVDNLHSFSKDMAGITSDNREDIRVAIKEIRGAAEKFDKLLAKLDKGDGTIGKLMSDKDMGEDLKTTFKEIKETAKQAKKVLYRMNLIETDWDYRLRYDTKQQFGHSDLGLKVIPNAEASPGKYYYLGVSNVGDSSVADGDIERKNTLNLLYGRTFNGFIPVDIFGGAMRSQGGIGIKAKPLAHWAPLSRLELTAEAYNFSRNVPVAKANVNLGARVKVNNWSFIGAQVEDVYNTSNTNAYMQLTFRDDDIAYILGIVGLSKP